MWSSSSRTKGGLGPQWIFTQAGNATHTFGALVDFKYEVIGCQIKMTLLGPDNSLTKEVSTVIEVVLLGQLFLLLEPAFE